MQLQRREIQIDELVAGVTLNRVEIRRLVKQLEKWSAAQGQPAQGCTIVIAQLRAALNRRGWKLMALSASSSHALRTSGLTIGIVR